MVDWHNFYSECPSVVTQYGNYPVATKLYDGNGRHKHYFVFIMGKPAPTISGDIIVVIKRLPVAGPWQKTPAWVVKRHKSKN